MKKKNKASLDPVVYTLLFVIRVFVCMCVCLVAGKIIQGMMMAAEWRQGGKGRVQCADQMPPVASHKLLSHCY